VVFVEVKTRRSSKFGGPEEAITQKKTEQVCKSAEGFILKYPEYADYNRRFDVIAVVSDGKSETIKHFENAF
jgi:putative endonuclease